MIPALTTASKIFSRLENNGSYLHLAVKDGANSAGMTAGSYITGDSLEGKDRFIDEVGAGLIWIGGVPIFNKVIDNTLFKAFKFDPKVDVRNLKNADILQKAKSYASDSAKSSIEKVAANQSKFKALNTAKFIGAAGLTVAAYFGLTVWRHKYTEENTKKKILFENRKKQTEQNNSHFFTGQPSFEAFYSGKSPLNPTLQGGPKTTAFTGMGIQQII
ncbi:MAG: hypothetical protein LBJ74_00895, partial [Heliobacteriaceae bacterium]|nr:hypothetical protein [Heliobacteriaceae bacterium]